MASVYDADGTRLVRRDATGTTLYLPGQEFRVQGATVTGTRYYEFAAGVIASRSGGTEAANLSWLYSDHQGTQQTAVNASTNVSALRRQTPYGEARGAAPTWPNERSFVGGTDDPTGLVQIGARAYDPALGRFISDDPVFDPGKPQQFDGYAYGGNNPVTNADPDGLCYKPCFDDEWYGPVGGGTIEQHMDRSRGEKRKAQRRAASSCPNKGSTINCPLADHERN